MIAREAFGKENNQGYLIKNITSIILLFKANDHIDNVLLDLLTP